MTRTCGGVTGGWMKVAELNITDTTHQCPGSLRYRAEGGKHLCARNLNAAGCSTQYRVSATVKCVARCRISARIN